MVKPSTYTGETGRRRGGSPSQVASIGNLAAAIHARASSGSCSGSIGCGWGGAGIGAKHSWRERFSNVENRGVSEPGNFRISCRVLMTKEVLAHL